MCDKHRKSAETVLKFGPMTYREINDVNTGLGCIFISFKCSNPIFLVIPSANYKKCQVFFHLLTCMDVQNIQIVNQWSKPTIKIKSLVVYMQHFSGSYNITCCLWPYFEVQSHQKLVVKSIIWKKKDKRRAASIHFFF